MITLIGDVQQTVGIEREAGWPVELRARRRLAINPRSRRPRTRYRVDSAVSAHHPHHMVLAVGDKQLPFPVQGDGEWLEE